MKAKDVMTRHVICVAPDTSILEALRLMLQHKISGLPVVNKIGNLVGHRQRRRFFAARRDRHGPQTFAVAGIPCWAGPLAHDYIRAHGRKVEEVMSADVFNSHGKHAARCGHRHDGETSDQAVPGHARRPACWDCQPRQSCPCAGRYCREFSPGPKSDEAIRNAVIAELDRQSGRRSTLSTCGP